MSIDLPLPALPHEYPVVLFRGAPPDDDALHEEIRAWIARRVPPARQGALLDLLDLVDFERGRLADFIPDPVVLDLWQPGVEEDAVRHRADHAIGITLALPPDRAELEPELTTAAARGVARALGGVVIEGNPPQLRPLDEQLEAPPTELDASDRIKVFTCESTGNKGVMGCTTLGLTGFGLPELVIRSAPVHLLTAIADIMKAAAAALVSALRSQDGPRLRLETLTVEGVDFGITAGTTEAGDDVLYLHPPESPGRDIGPLLAWVAMAQGGVDRTEFVYTEPDDPELVEAAAAVQRELPGIRKRFIAGLGPMVRLYVRAVLGDGDERETTWVAVSRFMRQQVRGRLVHQPRFTPLRAGQRIAVNHDQILDWRIEHPDGAVEGGRFEEVLQARLAG